MTKEKWGIVKVTPEVLADLLRLPLGHRVIDSMPVCTVRDEHIGLLIEGPLMPEMPEGENAEIQIVELGYSSSSVSVRVAKNQESDRRGAASLGYCRHRDCIEARGE